MKFAPEGLPYFAVLGVLTAAAWYLTPWLGLVVLCLLGFTAWFFRDPEREPERLLEPGDFLSPADGVVVEVEQAYHEFTGDAVKIGIFMSGTNVHVNRFPTEGSVEYIKYVPGKKMVCHSTEGLGDQRKTVCRSGKQIRPLCCYADCWYYGAPYLVPRKAGRHVVSRRTLWYD